MANDRGNGGRGGGEESSNKLALRPTPRTLRKPRRLLFAVLMGWLLASETVAADVEPTPPGDPTPALLNEARPVPLNPVPALAPADLVGVDIVGTLGVRDGLPVVRVARPFDVVIHWISRSVEFARCTVFLRVQGAGPVVERVYDPPSEMVVGQGIQQQRVTFEVPRFTHAGDGKLVVGFYRNEGPEPQVVLLGTWPITVTPIIVTSAYKDARIREVFGPDAIRTRASFRLGPGARIRVPIPEEVTAPIAGIGFVSSLVYGNVPQGELICTVAVEGPDATSSPPLEIRAGVNTALENYDKLRPGTQMAAKIEVFESIPVQNQVDWHLKPFERHRYVGRLPVPQPAAVRQLEFRYVRSEGMIDVKEVVLLPAQQ